MSLHDETQEVAVEPTSTITDVEPSSHLVAAESTENPSDETTKDDPSSLVETVEEMIYSNESERAIRLERLQVYLTKSKSGIDAPNDYGETALHVAADNGLLDAVQTLINFGAIVSVKDHLQRQPLHLACRGGHKEVVELLIERGADKEAREFQDATPLDVASWHGRSGIVKLLIAKGAEVLVKDRNGWSPLYSASRSGHEAAVRLLLGKDSSNIDNPVSDNRLTPLLAAIEDGHEQVAMTLIEMGANREIKDKGESTALHLSISHGLPKVAFKLLQKGARINTKGEGGMAELHLAVLHNYEDLVLELVGKDADIKIKDNQGMTPLHIASRHGNEKMVKLLLEKKAPLDVTDNDGNTPLHVAVGEQHEEDSQSGTDEDADTQDLHESNTSSDENTRNQDSEANSKLDAKYSQQAAVVRLLLKSHADIEAKNTTKKTAIDLVMDHKQPKTFQVLLEHLCQTRKREQPNTLTNWFTTNILMRDEFESLVLQLIDRSSGNKETQGTLELVLTTILDALKNWDDRNLRAQRPSVLWSLLAASRRSPDLVEKLDGALTSIERIREHILAQKMVLRSKKGPKKDLRTPQSPEENLNIKKSENKQRLSLNLDDKTSHQRLENSKDATGIRHNRMRKLLHFEGNVATQVLENLNILRDILRDPPFSQLHKDDYSKYKKPLLPDGQLETILERFDATVVEFYKGKSESAVLKRYRTVKEMIYGDGPTDIMKKAMEDLERMRAEKKVPISDILNARNEPKFVWVHLPSTNMDWMNDLLMGIMHSNGYKAPEYYELKSFFQDSWIQVPDGEVPSRIMKPRSLTRPIKSPGPEESAQKASMRKELTQEISDTERPAPEDNITDTERPQKISEAAKPLQATAIYMPYFCFSRSCSEDIHPRSSQTPEGYSDSDNQNLKNYRDLLRNYENSAIHRSPTLDEWYYHFVEGGEAEDDRVKRNRGQVVTRFLKNHLESKDNAKEEDVSKDNKTQQGNQDVKGGAPQREKPWTLLRVNQIWIWVVANSSYERKPDEDAKMSIGQIFSNYMNKIGRDETNLFNILCQWASKERKPQEVTKNQPLTWSSSTNQNTRKGTSMALPPVWTAEAMRDSFQRTEMLFRDIKDVRDELNILRSVIRFQGTVQKGLGDERAKDTSVSAEYIENDVSGMEDVADRIQSALNATLSLQQSEIANKQTEISTQQNTVLMTFTFATLLFVGYPRKNEAMDINPILKLPLSFLSSLFALDVETFQQAPAWAFYVIFFVSLGVSFIIGLGALSVNYLRDRWGELRGVFNEWTEAVLSSLKKEDGKKPNQEAGKGEKVDARPEATVGGYLKGGFRASIGRWEDHRSKARKSTESKGGQEQRHATSPV
ncbi:ankyrin unc44 [Fusarium sp. NRRL 52700]|nr:ankyrin unc44 [Fusarium sp. NRRL 52700]